MGLERCLYNSKRCRVNIHCKGGNNEKKNALREERKKNLQEEKLILKKIATLKL